MPEGLFTPDTIRYDILRALKSWRYGQLSGCVPLR